MDEKYVIIFGGWSTDKMGGNGETGIDEIYVFNITKMEWKKCKLKCPIAGLVRAVIVPFRKER